MFNPDFSNPSVARRRRGASMQGAQRTRTLITGYLERQRSRRGAIRHRSRMGLRNAF